MMHDGDLLEKGAVVERPGLLLFAGHAMGKSRSELAEIASAAVFATEGKVLIFTTASDTLAVPIATAFESDNMNHEEAEASAEKVLKG
eukprot:gene7096-16410_t